MSTRTVMQLSDQEQVAAEFDAALPTTRVADSHLRSPAPRWLHRRLLAQGLVSVEVAASPKPLVEALRLAGRRRANAATVASLMHAPNRFRRPRSESVLTAGELAVIRQPTTFIWGSQDPDLSSEDAAPSITRLPHATLHDVLGGHAPWLIDATTSAALVGDHFNANAAGGLHPARSGR